MPPGWYPDPFGAALRWWSGTDWTPHTAPYPPALFDIPNPAADLARERDAARRAALALLIGAAANAASLITAALVFSRWIGDLVDAIGLNQPGIPPVHFELAWLVPLQLLSFATLAVQILVMVWLYRAATLARRAGLPARRDPIWAVLGFFVPIVNIWFPYQVAADSFPPGDPARRLAGWWWGWTLAQSVCIVPVLIVSAFSTTAAVVVALLGATLPVMAAYEGRNMIAAIARAHERLIS